MWAFGIAAVRNSNFQARSVRIGGIQSVFLAHIPWRFDADGAIRCGSTSRCPSAGLSATIAKRSTTALTGVPPAGTTVHLLSSRESAAEHDPMEMVDVPHRLFEHEWTRPPPASRQSWTASAETGP